MTKKSILSRSEVIDGKYTIQFFIKKGSHAETYRVKDMDGQLLFLKLFDLSKLHRTQFSGEGDIKEIEFLKEVQHPNVVFYQDSGEWIHQNKRFAYLILSFVSGETLAERLKRQHTFKPYDITRILQGLLEGLRYLHEHDQPIVHNDINHHNVMLDLVEDQFHPKIIDFGYARNFHNSTKVYNREGLHPYYLAPECFNNIFSPQSDLYSVGVLAYHLLFGMPPWFINVPSYKQGQVDMEELLLNERRKPLKFPALNQGQAMNPEPEILLVIIRKALEPTLDRRFQSADEMLQVLAGKRLPDDLEQTTQNQPYQQPTVTRKKEGRGFDDIAGMHELKDVLYHDVIRALEEKELYKEYGLTIPNGMLLYGPPGCGKSFFAEKLAQEVSYNYVEVKPSALASIYVHGTQEKISQLFESAKANAPTILNFEEFDALVPSRDSQHGAKQSGEVNEFLAQLNNCGKDGIFVIATTNQPLLIDPAVLRAGRIDKVFYVPPPDLRARREMFKMLLKNRPVELGIDYDLLAEKTDHFVSVDIQRLVNEASRQALRDRKKISQVILLEVINGSHSSVSLKELRKHEQIKQEWEGDRSGNQKSQRRIGFNR